LGNINFKNQTVLASYVIEQVVVFPGNLKTPIILGVGVGVGSGVSVGVAVGSAVAVEVGVGVGVGDSVGVAVGVAVSVGLGEGDGLSSGDGLGVSVGEAVGVEVGLSVGVGVGGSSGSESVFCGSDTSLKLKSCELLFESSPLPPFSTTPLLSDFLSILPFAAGFWPKVAVSKSFAVPKPTLSTSTSESLYKSTV